MLHNSEELTLEEAAELALRENREVKVSRLELDKYADRLAVAKSYRLLRNSIFPFWPLEPA
jgi:hypothetical protein